VWAVRMTSIVAAPAATKINERLTTTLQPRESQ
jgi:hypothetical protein